MTANESTTRAILLWAINPDATVPDINAFAEAEDDLFQAVVHHRIASTLLSRLTANRPAWCPLAFVTRLRLHCFYAKASTQKQIAFAREMSAAMEAAGQPAPIFVKGFAGYALTNRADNLHYSGDLDPFAADLPAFWDVLHTLGYFGKRKYTHEWAKLSHSSGECTVDIHESFPSTVYPDALRDLPPQHLLAAENPGHWNLTVLDAQSEAAAWENALTWDDLYEHQQTGRAPGTETIHFPVPEALCLIHCAHIFRNALTRLHYLDTLNGLRLYELVTIRNLTMLPTWNHSLFETLTSKWQMRDAVQFVNTLAVTALNQTVLPGGVACDTTRFFPEHLPCGGWVCLKKTETFPLPRSVEEILTQMDAPIISLPFEEKVSAVPRLFLWGDPIIDFRLSIAWQGRNTLLIRWKAEPDTFFTVEQEFAVYFGIDSFVRVRVQNQGETEVTQKSDYPRSGQSYAHLMMNCDDGGRTLLEVVCPLPQLPKSLIGQQATTMPLLLSVRTIGDAPQSAFYVPLRVLPF